MLLEAFCERCRGQAPGPAKFHSPPWRPPAQAAAQIVRTYNALIGGGRPKSGNGTCDEPMTPGRRETGQVTYVSRPTAMRITARAIVAQPMSHRLSCHCVERPTPTPDANEEPQSVSSRAFSGGPADRQSPSRCPSLHRRYRFGRGGQFGRSSLRWHCRSQRVLPDC